MKIKTIPLVFGLKKRTRFYDSASREPVVDFADSFLRRASYSPSSPGSEQKESEPVSKTMELEELESLCKVIGSRAPGEVPGKDPLQRAREAIYRAAKQAATEYRKRNKPVPLHVKAALKACSPRKKEGNPWESRGQKKKR